MKTLRTSKLIEKKDQLYSVTISPFNGIYVVELFIKAPTKSGKQRTAPKRIFVNKIIEDFVIPTKSNDAVKHLGYNTYKYYQDGDFYINFYKK